MSKHTPGPWHFVPWHIEEGPPAVRCAEGWIVATTSTDADAEFLARAPAMEARIAEIEAENERLRQLHVDMKTKLAQYMAWYAMAEHQHLQEEARAERAEANAANWEEQANDRVSDWDEVRAERDALKLRLAAVEDMNAACNADFSRLRAERDALRADVERYRWLRSHPDGFWSCHEKDGYGGDVLKYGGDLDAAIDAARGEE